MKERIRLLMGDITTVAVDAIVNAANSRLLGGGGVDGAIHAVAGSGLYRECLTLGGCPTGEARITGGHGLKCRNVIHTVGPVWCGGGQGEEAILEACYRSSLTLAREHGLESLAFPSISTGAYGYPIAAAASVAVRTVRAVLQEQAWPGQVLFVCFDPEVLSAYRTALAECSEGPSRGGYQERDLLVREVHGVPFRQAPRPPYFSFHAAPVKGVQPFEHGLTTQASWRAAKALAGGAGEVHAVYVRTTTYFPLDLRDGTLLSSQQQGALGLAAASDRSGDVVLKELLARFGDGLWAHLQELGFSGTATGPAGRTQWGIFSADCIKTTRVVEDPAEGARLEAFEPDPISQSSLHG